MVSATHCGMSSEFPREMLATMMLEQHGGKPKFTLVHAGTPSGEDRELARAGWSGLFDKLAAAVN